MPTLSTEILIVLAVMFAALLAGSCVRLLTLWYQPDRTPPGVAQQRRQSLIVWWVLTIAFAGALLYGRLGMAVLCCCASLLALDEFHRIFERRTSDSPLFVGGLSLLAMAHYAVLGFTDSLFSLWSFPLLAMLVVTTLELVAGQVDGYLRTTAGYFWASMLIVFGLSHVVALTGLPPAGGAQAIAPVTWCIYVIVLTEVNDIAQALVGRKFGQHKITPTFSPGKTWEGLVGGLVVSAGLALLLAPWLTSLREDRSFWLGSCISVCSGLLISICGFLGDLNMSGLKREAGVKDSSPLLPGMGGMIDRIDSLTLSAPASYYFALWLAPL